MKKILTIEKVIKTGNKRGIMFLPTIPISFFNNGKIPEYVELRTPNGSIEKRKATFTSPRLYSKDDEIQYLIMLQSGRQEQFPIGTEIWGDITYKY